MIRARSVALVVSLVCALFAAPACESATTTAQHVADPGPVSYDDHGTPVGLDRYHRWSDRIGQGAQPEGDEAFRNLAALGYTTILSVDGSRPDVQAAAKWGLRYVHVPIEYSGISREQELKIVKAVQTADGPVFVHCHHGKHRGPAGGMIARMAIDGVDAATAVEDLKSSGCSPNYPGLYRDVAAFVPPSAAELATVPDDLPSVVEPAGILDAMVDVDFRNDLLKACKEAGWRTPEKHPDVSPKHEATMLWEHYRELARLDESKAKGAEFMQLLAAEEHAAKTLEEALARNDAAAADGAFQTVSDGCNTCHKKYRNE